ncbi:MAG: zinc-binding dehydrogenase, partial [Acidimicrobiia bacterium]
DVIITGAGPIGAMSAAIVRHVGARFVAITDVNQYRLDLAAEMGVDRVVNVADTGLDAVMSELGMVEGFDVGLEMSGTEAALNQMLEAMNHGGRVAVLGIPAGDVRLAVSEVIFKGITLRGIYGRRIFETWYKMSAMLQTGLDIDAVITHSFPASDYEEAFDLVRSGQSGKVLLEW